MGAAESSLAPFGSSSVVSDRESGHGDTGDQAKVTLGLVPNCGCLDTVPGQLLVGSRSYPRLQVR